MDKFRPFSFGTSLSKTNDDFSGFLIYDGFLPSSVCNLFKHPITKEIFITPTQNP